ncbi:hypothetical protein [Kribbella sp. NPDC004536]|uniref:hypothetical protein n=1 Tax=Kribbella sp. NPDC004536 TaxID=3364106 RepID=UPI0036738CDA
MFRILAATALGLGSAAFGPAAAHAAPQAGLVITHIKCNQQEDNTGADDAYLVVDGATIWGPVQMTDGDSKDIQRVAVPQGKVLTLMEGDWPDDDDNLGAKTVNGPGDYSFTDDGANYVVTIANG